MSGPTLRIADLAAPVLFIILPERIALAPCSAAVGLLMDRQIVSTYYWFGASVLLILVKVLQR
jgi:hypothetical protein